MLLPWDEGLRRMPHVHRRDRGRAAGQPGVVHGPGRRRHGRQYQDRRRYGLPQGHHGPALVRASPRLPHLPQDRPVRSQRHMPQARVRQRQVRYLSQERAVRAEGHRAVPRDGHGHAADLQQQADTAPRRRPHVGHGPEPVHRLRQVRQGVRRGEGGTMS